MKPAKWTVVEGTKLCYFTKFTLDESRRVRNIFICHPEAVRMVQAWYFVVLIDSTYKTNLYKKVVVRLIGVTPVKKNFNIGLALVEDETKESYAWVLNKLKVMLGSRLPDAFVTDKERSLGLALAEIFPSSRHLLCI